MDSDIKKVECFKCKQKFIRKHVRTTKKYSLKNNWDYWTEKEENKGKYICNSCLLNLYHNDKLTYSKEVTNTKKRQILYIYIHSKTIS